MLKILLTSLLTVGIVFSNTGLVNNSNLVPYIGESNVGVQVNPVLIGTKGKKLNQEMSLNLVLYYQKQYTIKDEQVLGHIEGRFVSEEALNDFNLYDRIEKDRSLEISNFAQGISNYDAALRIYRQLSEQLPAYSNVVNRLAPVQSTNTITNNTPASVVSTVIEPQIVEQQVITEPVIQQPAENAPVTEEEIVEEQIEYTETPEYEYEYEYVDEEVDDTQQAFVYQTPKFVAQKSVLSTNIKNSLTPDELKLMIQVEQLKKELDHYRKQDSAIPPYESEFDPADPYSRFTVALVNDNGFPVWSKSFGLDGKKSYQSYNTSVWYLGYTIPITKSDIRQLHKLFSENKNVSYYITGPKRTVDFKLSSYFIQAMKELTESYVQGKFVMKDQSRYPMMSESQNASQ